MKNVTKFLITLSLCIMSFPFSLKVKADAPTYAVISGKCNLIASTSSRSYYISISNSSSEVRAVIIRASATDSNGNLFLVSENDFTNYISSYSANACNPDSTAGYSTTSVGSTGYAVVYTTARYNTYNGIFTVPVVIDSNSTSPARAVYYTFGDGAIAPDAEIPDYGDLILKGYKTDIAGPGNAAVNNKDTISWEPVDTNGNDITNCQVRIRAIPGQYSAESRTTLLQKLRTDFVTDVLHATDLGVYPAREEKHTYSWSKVIDVLALPFLSITSLMQRDNHWIKNGWIYQIRLEDEENNYIGQWQTVYTATAAGVQNDLTVINSTSLSQDLINVITEINNNNNVTNNWTIINIIIVPNPDPTPTQEPGTDPCGNNDWISALLQAIVDLISGILSFLGGIVQSIIDGILGLFSFDDFELYDIINLFNDEVNQQNLIGQTYFFWDEVIETAQSMRNTDPIINWPGITIMGVDLIPAATYNLNDYVSQLGLTDLHNLVYIVTDGSIAICLLWMIHKKIMAVLHL